VKTLEYAYDDWCVSVMANALGKTESRDVREAGGRTGGTCSISIGLMRGKTRRAMADAFRSARLSRGGDSRGTSWQYTWYVPHRRARPDRRWADAEVPASWIPCSSRARRTRARTSRHRGAHRRSMARQRPSHHMCICMLGRSAVEDAGAGAPHPRHAIRRQANSLTGNDDCGQMSAWYLFSTMGSTPSAPAPTST